jgi:predicted PurR-regulated permease PerM
LLSFFTTSGTPFLSFGFMTSITAPTKRVLKQVPRDAVIGSAVAATAVLTITVAAVIFWRHIQTLQELNENDEEMGIAADGGDGGDGDRIDHGERDWMHAHRSPPNPEHARRHRASLA